MARGLTKVQAVSRMLLGLRTNKISALDPGGAAGLSLEADAEGILDQVIDEFIIAGHPSTTRAAVSFTATGGGEVDLSGSPLILAVRGVGKHAGRKLTIRADKVYDEGYGATACFVAAETVLLDVFEQVSAASPANYESLDPALKIQIADAATQRFRYLKAPDMLMDQMLGRETVKAAQIAARRADRYNERPDAAPFGVFPPTQGRNPNEQA